MLDSVYRLKFGPRRFLDALRQEIAARPYQHLTVKPIGVTIGAEICGADLREPIPEFSPRSRRETAGMAEATARLRNTELGSKARARRREGFVR